MNPVHTIINVPPPGNTLPSLSLFQPPLHPGLRGNVYLTQCGKMCHRFHEKDLYILYFTYSCNSDKLAVFASGCLK